VRCVVGWKNGDKGERGGCRQGQIIRSLPCDGPLPCAQLLCRAPELFAVRQSTAKDLCRAHFPLPCASARQRIFAMCYRTAKSLFTM
jgi:hypothetical protein